MEVGRNGRDTTVPGSGGERRRPGGGSTARGLAPGVERGEFNAASRCGLHLMGVHMEERGTNLHVYMICCCIPKHVVQWTHSRKWLHVHVLPANPSSPLYPGGGTGLVRTVGSARGETESRGRSGGDLAPEKREDTREAAQGQCWICLERVLIRAMCPKCSVKMERS